MAWEGLRIKKKNFNEIKNENNFGAKFNLMVPRFQNGIIVPHRLKIGGTTAPKSWSIFRENTRFLHFA